MMKVSKTLISLLFGGMTLVPAVQAVEAEDAAVHYLYLTIAQDGEHSYATMSSNILNLDPVGCPPELALCDRVGMIVPEGVAYYADRPAAYEVTSVMEVSGSDARVATTYPVGVEDIYPGVGPIGPVDPRKDLIEVLEGLLGADGAVTDEYEAVYHLLIQIVDYRSERAFYIASNVLDVSCDELDRLRKDAPWCGYNVGVRLDPPEGTVYYTDKADAYLVTDVMDSSSSDRRVAVMLPVLGDDTYPGVGPIGPVDPRRIIENLIGEILQCQKECTPL